MSFTINSQENYKNYLVQPQSMNFICPVCDSVYVNKKEFYSHLHIHAGDVLKQMQHLKPNIINESKTELKCCNQKKINDNLYQAVLRPFKCQQCNLTFDRASQCDYHHRSIHLGEKSQLCEICGKGFFRKADLRTHLNIHLGTNFCICEICGRKFNHVSNLIRHCRMHAGVKPYPCCICGKRFTQISSVVRHKRIHERLKNDIKQQLQNSYDNINMENEDQAVNKDKFVEGHVSVHQKVIKRQHYCKICGKSFSFIFLLREHEKIHSQDTANLECKNNDMLSKENEKYNCNANNIDLPEDETSMKKVLPLDTIIYITSEQLKKINLENIEDIKDQVPQEHLNEPKEKILTTNELSVSEKIVVFSNDQTQFIHDNPILLCKTSDSIEKGNVAYVCQVDENILKNTLSIQSCESDIQKLETLQNYNNLTNASLNVTDMFQKIDLSEPHTDEQINSDSNLQDHQEINSGQAEKIPDDSSDVDITNHDESMLRLVQTETGEQFYEFLINNLVEKLPSTQSAKVSGNDDESANISENVTNNCLDIKSTNEDIHQEENIRDDIHNDLSYTPYELQPTDFDKYVETNFEVFERLNYDDSSERLFEFVETTGVGKISECKESEQFLQFQNFNKIDAIQQNENSTIINDNEEIINKDPPCNILNQINEPNEDQAQRNDSIENNEKIDQQDSKISKVVAIKFQCTVCEKSFSTSYNYKQHIGTHFADQQKFHCKECKMSFAWKSTLNKHIASNHRPEGPQRFACDICKKIYSTSSQVNEHVKRDHLKERNHVCSQCGKSFFKKYDLKIHNRIHTDERPYVCRACGKRFHHRSHIIRHERIHL
ncbi:zinc finger protein 480-like [Osmia bicornis bicornis]|uniref:zinc finger protein 480-like n=1 Tax=Osmia bicornis bicornis TaxID=1437191 RepID=UPI0010F6AABF|nr:zinc finger protein 480-like [Osmia bicornis bicornis]